MRSVILLLSFLAIAAWGYFCVVKLEDFMAGLVRVESNPSRINRETFKIMLENPIVADSLLETIKRTKSLDEVAVVFYTGSIEEIREQTAENEMDLAVDLPVEPIIKQTADIYIIWNEKKLRTESEK